MTRIYTLQLPLLSTNVKSRRTKGCGTQLGRDKIRSRNETGAVMHRIKWSLMEGMSFRTSIVRLAASSSDLDIVNSHNFPDPPKGIVPLWIELLGLEKAGLM